jgi:pilus assembly protein Flp/PilA
MLKKPAFLSVLSVEKVEFYAKLKTRIFFFLAVFLFKILFTGIFQKEVKKMVFPHVDKGQGLVEYALIIALIAIVIVVILTLFGQQIANLYENVVAGF